MTPPYSIKSIGRTSLVAALGLLAIVALPSCSTSKTGQTAEAPAEAADSPKARGLLAKGGQTARARYIDPALVSAHSPTLVADAATATPDEEAPPSVDGTAGDAMAQGVVTQPTGIRAGTVSIFSGAPVSTAPVSAGPAAAGSVPPPPPGRMDARAGSLFGSPPAAAPVVEACGTDHRGLPISC
ncbi:hypothetical protein REJC140_00177 [Pseudorhizobium endolithicum]|uniref:Lipoprotein n=1 Tax=Pseudorhizobium endolithicum TaxID=1191678 RepID=A0ABN7JDW0_9HYPH|nr:hypothetical protein [Pseudorhizobium endolithicum]CAD7023346.1 hypothetical protein REJC140_00177 [Pseudorhizobium endolithicum]